MPIDLFHHVHTGIRAALFDAVIAGGRGDADALAKARDALRFTAHHGENEDLLLLPLVRERLPTIAARMQRSHAHLDAELHGLIHELEDPACAAEPFARRLAAFTGRYLDHVDDEETLVDPAIRAVVDEPELAAFGARSIARTAPADARMMLRLMLPVLPAAVGRDYLAKLPTSLADELRRLVPAG